MHHPEDIFPSPEIPFNLLHTDSSYLGFLLKMFDGMSEKLLTKIAKQGYDYDEKECYTELKQIVQSKSLPTVRSQMLVEALEMSRWLIPNDSNEHQCRFFSCALLLIFERESEYNPSGELSNTLAPLLESATVPSAEPLA